MTAWPTTPPAFEMIAFAYDGWSVLRIGRTEHSPLTYEATHPELPGDVLVAGSLGEARDLMDDTRAAWALEAEAAAYAEWEAEQDRRCDATRHAGSVAEPYGIGCDLDRFHSGAHIVADPFGPDTGTWTWTPGPRGNLTRWEA